MSESVELLKAKLRDCRAECDRLHREKMERLSLVAQLQNQIFAQSEAVAVPQVDRWFVDQSPSTTKGRGYMDLVAASVPRVEAERIAVERQVEYPDAIIHVWQHPDDARAEALEAVAVPSTLTCEKCGGSRYYCKNCRCADCGNTFTAPAPSADLRALIAELVTCSLPDLPSLLPTEVWSSAMLHAITRLQAALDRGDIT